MPPGAAPGPGGGGRVGRARASPAPEPSLSLASHVNLELLVSSLLQPCKREWGLGLVILGLAAVARVVLLEVEQAACTKGMTTMELE